MDNQEINDTLLSLGSKKELSEEEKTKLEKALKAAKEKFILQSPLKLSEFEYDIRNLSSRDITQINFRHNNAMEAYAKNCMMSIVNIEVMLNLVCEKMGIDVTKDGNALYERLQAQSKESKKD